MTRVALGLVVAIGLAAGACGDDGGGGGGGDTSTANDVVGGDTTQPGTDTTQPGTDTTQPTTDTTQPPPQRMCTDAELQAFDTCAAGCGTPQCQQGCLTSELSSGCQLAYQGLAQCAQTNGCGEDLTCIAANCPDEVAAVFGTVEPSDCDPVTNAGCEAGQNCTFVTQTDLGCSPAGTAGYGEDCANVGCERGACLTFDEINYECLEFCEPGNNTCREDRPCNVSALGSDFNFCGNIPLGCDLFAQDCPNGQGCYIVDQQGSTDCIAPPGTGQAGTQCQFINDCAPGHVCTGTCAVLCTTDGEEPCATGTCTSIGVGNLGACQ